MTCGLVTFATDKGGPVEIIEHSKSGFHIDPYHGENAAELMADFFEKCAKEKGQWDEVSKGAIERILTCYTWKIYAERLMTLSRVYRLVTVGYLCAKFPLCGWQRLRSCLCGAFGWQSACDTERPRLYLVQM